MEQDQIIDHLQSAIASLTRVIYLIREQRRLEARQHQRQHRFLVPRALFNNVELDEISSDSSVLRDDELPLTPRTSDSLQ
jgi:hypothetical protein